MMRNITRRDFVKGSLAAGLAMGLPLAAGAAAPSEQVRLAFIGLGGIDVPGSVGGRGRQLINSFLKVPGAKVAALCDVDPTILAHGAKMCEAAGQKVATYSDLRKVLAAKDIDAVVVATPDHWHVLAAIWACQAGKDVYVEKPMSYNIWEGRQLAAAMKKYGRMVQVGTQGRSSDGLREGFEYIHSGQLGKMQYAYALNYRSRESIGKVTAPTPVPPGVDYNTWCGPAPMSPIQRQYMHYQWHWFWQLGTAETGNNGVHYLDMCRWALKLEQHPRRVMSIGGRYAFNDDGQTPNTQIVFYDYAPVPVICEIRNLPEKPGAKTAGKFRGQSAGLLIQCEGGYFAGTHPGGKAFDNKGKEIKDFTATNPEVAHLANFIEAVRSRDASKLHCPAVEGHHSAACSHMANISYRIGAASAPEAIAEATRFNPQFAASFESCQGHLRANGVNLGKTPLVMGPWVSLDPASERFTGEFAKQANALAMREYRKGFAVPELA